MHPWIARRIVYPLQERALGRPTFQMLASLESTQWLPRKEVEATQARKLNALLRLALAHSPWHGERIRAAGAEGDVLSGRLTLADLPRLPTMSRSHAREQLQR